MRGAEPFALEDVAFADAGALDDPLVAGIDHLGQFGVGENVGRHIAEHPGDRRADRGFADGFLQFAHAGFFAVAPESGRSFAALAKSLVALAKSLAALAGCPSQW